MTNDAKALAADAMRAHRAGDFARAESLTRSALAEDANHAPSLVHLAVLLRHQGRFEQAYEAAQSAIRVAPDSPDGYMQAGLCCLGAGRPADSVTFLSRVLDLAPDLGPAHFNLGLALENLGRRSEAKAEFLNAIRIDPRDEQARMNLGALLLAERDEAGAVAQAEAALRANPQASAPHLLKARVFVSQGKGTEAEMSIRGALARDPNSAFGYTMLGFRLLQKGEFGEAERAFHRSLRLDPAQGTGYFGITQARRFDDSDRPLVSQMQATLTGIPLTYEEAGYLHFALAKAFDNLGEYEAAMRHCHEAHRNQQLAQYGEERFDAAAHAARFEAVARTYSAERMRRPPKGLETDVPIFIVGMMRSGTTLAEQILSSHPAVEAAGEQPYWANYAHLCEDAKASRFDETQAVALAREYFRVLRRGSPGGRRITDKLPGNYVRLGLLHRAMPNAKIVHCRRDPIDTALSIYMTPNPMAPLYGHSLDGIAAAYRAYARLVEHWRSVLPADRFFDLQYEDLIAHPEPTIRRLLEFLDLPWDDACLRHDQNAKDVRTPSLWQVRQPLYTGSIGRWKRYEPWLGALAGLAELA